MAYNIEFHKGSELHVRARKQKQLFFGGIVLACILYAIGTYNDPSFFQTWFVLFVVLWCLCVPAAFNGAVCESIAEVFIEHDTIERNATECDTSSSANQPIFNSAWYTISLIAILGVPAIAAIIAATLTQQPAYLLIVIVAVYFAIRNHKLYNALQK